MPIDYSKLIVPDSKITPYNKSSFGDYKTESQYDTGAFMGEDLGERRARKQTFWDSLGNATVRGLIGTTSAIGETVSALTDWKGIYNRITGKEDDFGNALMKVATENRNYAQTAFPEYHSNDFGKEGWWMNGYSSVLETMGYLAVGGAVGEGFGLAGKAVGLTNRATQLVQGIGTAITMNYAEGVQIAHDSYQNMLAQGISKEIASKNASKLIDANRLNILFEIPEYFSLFRVSGAYNYTRQFKNLDKGFKAALGEFAKQGVFEGSEEVIQGYMQSELERQARLENATNILKDPGASSTQKNKAKEVLQSENLNTSAVTRFKDYILSEQGLTEGIFGAFGGMVFQGGAELKEHLENKGKTKAQAIAAARELVSSNPASVMNLLRSNDQVDEELQGAIDRGDKVERDRLIRQKFINLASMNAMRGTYSQFMRTLEGLSTMTNEELQEFGVDEDYMREQLPQMLNDAKFIESIYDDAFRKFEDLPADTDVEKDVKSKMISSALNLKWQYREFENFRKKVSDGKNKLYSENVPSEERPIIELKHQIEAYNNLFENKSIREIINAEEQLDKLHRALRDAIKVYNQFNNTNKTANDFTNPLVDDPGVDLTTKEIMYNANKEQAKKAYNNLVKDKQKTFEESKKQTKENIEKEAEYKQTAQQEAENLQKKKEQVDIVNRTKFKQYNDLIKSNINDPKALQDILTQLDHELDSPLLTKNDKNDLKSMINSYLGNKEETDLTEQESENLPEESRGSGSLDDIIRAQAEDNIQSEQEVHDKNSDLTGEEAYNPLPQEFEKEVNNQEQELFDQDEDYRLPNPGANVSALAVNLMNYTTTRSGRYIHTDEVNPTANPKMFDPDFLKPGMRLVIFVNKDYESYDKYKDDINEIPLTVVREEDYNNGDREPIAYIHRVNWYRDNETIPEEQRIDLAEQTRLLRNTIFQTKDENGEFIPHVTTVIDKSNGVITKSDKEHSIFEVSDNPNLVVADSSVTFKGMTEEQKRDLKFTKEAPFQTKDGYPMTGVPFLLVKSPSGKWFPKFVKTHKLNETTIGDTVGTTIYNIFKEFYTNPNSPLLLEAKIKNFMDIAYEIKKFVYFGDKTQNLDQRKLFFATEDGKVNIQGQIFDFNKEIDQKEFIKAIGELYTTVNSRHLDPKENSKFSYLTWQNDKFTRQYSPYKKFLDQMEFISINSKPNYSTIFGNYVTKIDNNIKPLEQTVITEEVSLEQLQENVENTEKSEEKVAKEHKKGYIKSNKKSPFKRATDKKQISDEEATRRNNDCK